MITTKNCLYCGKEIRTSLICGCDESELHPIPMEKTAAGIVSYLASPQDFIKQKKEEFVNVLKEGITFSGQTNSYLMNQSIFDWLEQLIKDLAAR